MFSSLVSLCLKYYIAKVTFENKAINFHSRTCGIFFVGIRFSSWKNCFNEWSLHHQQLQLVKSFLKPGCSLFFKRKFWKPWIFEMIMMSYTDTRGTLRCFDSFYLFLSQIDPLGLLVVYPVQTLCDCFVLSYFHIIQTWMLHYNAKLITVHKES